MFGEINKKELCCVWVSRTSFRSQW